MVVVVAAKKGLQALSSIPGSVVEAHAGIEVLCVEGGHPGLKLQRSRAPPLARLPLEVFFAKAGLLSHIAPDGRAAPRDLLQLLVLWTRLGNRLGRCGGRSQLRPHPARTPSPATAAAATASAAAAAAAAASQGVGRGRRRPRKRLRVRGLGPWLHRRGLLRPRSA